MKAGESRERKSEILVQSEQKNSCFKPPNLNKVTLALPHNTNTYDLKKNNNKWMNPLNKVPHRFRKASEIQ